MISFNLINYAAGLTTISWWTFTWATALGILPLTCLMVLMGDGIWSGDTNVWLWLMAAAVAGWFLWWLVAQKSRRRGGLVPLVARGAEKPPQGRRGGAPARGIGTSVEGVKPPIDNPQGSTWPVALGS